MRLPPGRPRLGTSPNPTGSTTPTKTTGTDVVAFLAARAAGPAEARMTSTFKRTSSSGQLGKLVDAAVGGADLHKDILAIDYPRSRRPCRKPSR